MKVFRVKDWDLHFENNKSREREQCSYVCVPNKQHGMGFCRIASLKDGASIYGIWVMILCACSQQRRRDEAGRAGWLTLDGHQTGTPWAPEDLAVKFRRTEAEIKRALDVLTSENIGWIEVFEVSQNGEILSSARSVPAECPPGALEEKRREEKGIEEKRKEVEVPSPIAEVFNEWNNQNVLPKCAILNEQRKKHLKARLAEKFFLDNWRAAMERIRKSSFATGKNDRGWKADFDWFLQPNVVPKIVEGKYDDRDVFINSPPHIRLQAIQQKINESPANRESMNANPNCTQAERDQLKAWRKEIQDITTQIANQK